MFVWRSKERTPKQGRIGNLEKSCSGLKKSCHHLEKSGKMLEKTNSIIPRKGRVLRFESESNSAATSDGCAQKLGNNVRRDSESVTTSVCSQICRK